MDVHGDWVIQKTHALACDWVIKKDPCTSVQADLTVSLRVLRGSEPREELKTGLQVRAVFFCDNLVKCCSAWVKSGAGMGAAVRANSSMQAPCGIPVSFPSCLSMCISCPRSLLSGKA